MFEVWESVEEPMFLLVFRESASFPGRFAVEDWVQLGLSQVTDAIAGRIGRRGHVTLRTVVPFDPGAVLDGTIEA